MATHQELSQFTHEDLRRMNLLYGDLCQMTDRQLLEIAQNQLTKFKKLPPSQHTVFKKVLPLLEAIGIGIASNLATEKILSTDWKHLLLELLNFFSKLFSE